VRTRSLNGVLTSVFSSTFFNELRAQWGRDQEPGEANTNNPEVTAREAGTTILVFGRNFFSPRETTIKRFQVADAVTWIRGTHSLKTGFDLNFDNIFNFFPGNFGGRYTFSSVASLGRGLPNGSGENYQQAFAGVGTTGPETHPDLKEYAFFLQDEWKASRKLTVSFGLRYDLQDIAQPDVRNPDPQLAAAGIDTSFIHVDKNNFAPRLGLSFTPDPKTVVRAGYGLFYGRTPSIMIGTAHSGNASTSRPSRSRARWCRSTRPCSRPFPPGRRCRGRPSSSSIPISRTRKCTRPASASSEPFAPTCRSR
jgi:outer membrane receptor protein involved in Fe transport